MSEEYAELKDHNFAQFRRDFDEQRPVARAKPTQIWLETTSRCNLKCRTCPRCYVESQLGADMPLDVFRRVEEALFPTLKHVELQGWGEPLLSETFPAIYDSARRHGVRVSFITNGTLLTRDWLERFVADDTGLMISVDGATDETMHDVRGVGLGRIEERIAWYNEIKSRAPSTQSNLHLVFVALRRNIAELPRLVERAAEWKAVSILVVHLHRAGLPEEMQREHLSLCPELANSLFLESFELAQRFGIALELPPLFSVPGAPATESAGEALRAAADEQSYHYCGLGLFRSDDPRSPYPNRCPDPWLKCYIDVHGNVQPCCAYVRVFGNIVRQPFDEIWNGPLYQRLRRKIHSRVPPLFCRECNLIYGIPAGNPIGCLSRLGPIDRALLQAQRLKRRYHVWRESRPAS